MSLDSISQEFTEKEYVALRAYLVCHEPEIVTSMNDFGDLKDVFTAVIGREPT
jgi:hypothetical protein